jgi:lipoprotein signal peptidase
MAPLASQDHEHALCELVSTFALISLKRVSSLIMYPTVSGQVSEGPRVIDFHKTMEDSLAFGTLNSHDSLVF